MAVDVCCEIASLVTSPRISFSHDDGIPMECQRALVGSSRTEKDCGQFDNDRVAQVDVCCEIASLVTSPRISFSHDDGIPIECQQQQQQHYRSDAFLLESSSSTIDFDFDFDFCVTDQQLLISSADELFSNGKILPIEVKRSSSSTTTTTAFAETNQSLQKQPLLENGIENISNKKKSLKEFLLTDLDEEEDADEDEENENQETEKSRQTKPFWQFRRSNSLNYYYQNSQNNGFLHFLTRSNSTGSTTTPKNPKIYQTQSSQREKIKVLRKSSSLSSSSTSSSSSSSSFTTNFSSYNQSHPLHSSSKKGQSHPLKKSYSRSNYGNNGVHHVSPVLNIPHGYISKGTVCLFGLGSFFRNGKSKKKK